VTYLVVRLLHDRGVYQPHTDVLGDVEVRSPRGDLLDETRAIALSRSAHGIPSPEADTAMRAATIVTSGSPVEADAVALERFELTADLRSLRAAGLSRHDVTAVGFRRDLSSGQIAPALPRKEWAPGPAFALVRKVWEGPDVAQWLASQPPSDLRTRLLRGLRWKRLADLEPNRQLKVLFRWFVVEATLRLKPEEDLVPWVLTFLGFPSGGVAAALDTTLRDELHAIPNYRSWREQVRNELAQVRDYRNDTVHSGFRPHDVSEQDLRRWVRLMSMVAPRVLHGVEEALLMGMVDPATMRSDAHRLLNAHGNLVNDLRGNLLHILGQNVDLEL